MILEYFLTQAHIDQGEVIVKALAQAGVDLMIEIESVNDSFPDDPVEIYTESLLKVAVVKAWVEGVFDLVERRPRPNIEINLITDTAADGESSAESLGIVETNLIVYLTGSTSCT